MHIRLLINLTIVNKFNVILCMTGKKIYALFLKKSKVYRH